MKDEALRHTYLPSCLSSHQYVLGIIASEQCYDIGGRGENELDIYIEIGPKGNI